jgi:tetratricopeptide (TPR) repeat protein
MKSKLRICAYLILAASAALVCACDSFNLFSWINGNSQNYDSLMADANAAFAAGNDATALDAYAKALQLKPNDVPALDGCIRAELSLLSSRKIVSSAFPQFFVNRGEVSNLEIPIFSNMKPEEQNVFRAHILAIRKNMDTLGEIYMSTEAPLKSQHTRFAADAGFVYSMNTLLLAEDSNQNGILGEEDDLFYVGAAFDLIYRTKNTATRQYRHSPQYPYLAAVIQDGSKACFWFQQLVLINPDIIGQNSSLYELYSNISYFITLCASWS